MGDRKMHDGTFIVYNTQKSTTFYEVAGKEMNKLTAVKNFRTLWMHAIDVINKGWFGGPGFT